MLEKITHFCNFQFVHFKCKIEESTAYIVHSDAFIYCLLQFVCRAQYLFSDLFYFQERETERDAFEILQAVPTLPQKLFPTFRLTKETFDEVK